MYSKDDATASKKLNSLIQTGMNLLNGEEDAELPRSLRVAIYETFGPPWLQFYDRERKAAGACRELASPFAPAFQPWEHEADDFWIKGRTSVGHARRFALGCCSFLSVLPLWRRAYSQNYLPQICFLTAAAAMEGKVPLELASALLGITTGENRIHDYEEWILAVNNSPLCIRRTDYRTRWQEATRRFVGLKKFDIARVVYDAGDTYSDYVIRRMSATLLFNVCFDETVFFGESRLRWADLYYKFPFDVADLAAGVMTGGRRENNLSGNPEERRACWKWWLTEAVPFAFNAVEL